MPAEKSNESKANLNEYFHRELIKNLTELNTLISVEHGKRMSKNTFLKAGAIIEDIHDLSMVHGFDSIEAIAEKLTSTALKLNTRNDDNFKEAFVKIRAGIRAIVDILKISQDSLNDNVDKLAQTSQKEGASPDGKKGEQFFDIKEIDSLMKLIEEQQATSINEFSETETRGLEQAFDEVFREEALEILNQFKDALEKLNAEKITTGKLLSLKNAVSALLDAAKSYKVDSLEEVSEKLIQFCENKLKTGLPVERHYYQILIESEKMLRKFVIAFPDSELNCKRFMKIFNEANSDSQTDTAKPAAELLKPKPAIKSKALMTKEEIRRRWILKNR